MKTSTTLLAVLLAFGTAATLAATTEPVKTELEGVVESVDLGAKTFTVKSGGRIEAFEIAPDSKIFHEGKASDSIPLRDLRRGDYVVVELEPGVVPVAAKTTETHQEKTEHRTVAHQKALRVHLRRDVQTVEGTVKTVDASGAFLEVRIGEKLETFHVTKDTLVVSSLDVPIRLAEFRAGETVIVHYKVDGGKSIAHRLVKTS